MTAVCALVLLPTQFALVPKKRLELSRPFGHPALNRARLPFRHLGVSAVCPKLRVLREEAYGH